MTTREARLFMRLGEEAKAWQVMAALLDEVAWFDEEAAAGARFRAASLEAFVRREATPEPEPSPESPLDRATRWSGTEPPEPVAPGALLRTLDDTDEEPGEPDGECFRGAEADAFGRWQMDTWQRGLKR